MSVITTGFYRNEAGVHSNPAVSGSIDTHCGTDLERKPFKEVFIHWNGSAWVEDATFNPEGTNTRAALKVENPCDNSYAYINTGWNDFRLAQLCCAYSAPTFPGLALRFTNLSIADGVIGGSHANVADWNNYLFTVMGGVAITQFTSVQVVGLTVYLLGGSGVEFPVEAFNGVAGLTHVVDYANCVIEVGDFAFASPNLVTVNLPACEVLDNYSFYHATSLVNVSLPVATIVGIGVFDGCTSLKTITLPAATVLGQGVFNGCNQLETAIFPLVATVFLTCFQGCTSLKTIQLPSCSQLGNTSGDDDVFQGISGNTIAFTILTATATDGDVVELQANNSVTLTTV